MSELVERQEQLLNKLCELFAAHKMPGEFHDDESGQRLLICEHFDLDLNNESAYGMYTFLPPVDEDEGNMRFVANVILNDDVDPISEYVLRQEISRVNYLMPFGTYLLSPDGAILSYRNITTIHSKLTDEDAVETMFQEVVFGLSQTALWMDALNQLAAGVLSVDDFEEILKDHLRTATI